jgi:hypothetical protein
MTTEQRCNACMPMLTHRCVLPLGHPGDHNFNDGERQNLQFEDDYWMKADPFSRMKP